MLRSPGIGSKVRTAWEIGVVVVLALQPCGGQAAQPGPPDDERGNFFGDPFVQVTDGLTNCPAPPGPRITRSEMRAEAHYRAERGTSCYQSGRCRLPNAYLYDKEIIPRVRKAVLADGRFAGTSVWAEGQRRWVWLKGCVQRSEQATALEQIARGIEDVEAVLNELVVVP